MSLKKQLDIIPDLILRCSFQDIDKAGVTIMLNATNYFMKSASAILYHLKDLCG